MLTYESKWIHAVNAGRRVYRRVWTSGAGGMCGKLGFVFATPHFSWVFSDNSICFTLQKVNHWNNKWKEKIESQQIPLKDSKFIKYNLHWSLKEFISQQKDTSKHTFAFFDKFWIYYTLRRKFLTADETDFKLFRIPCSQREPLIIRTLHYLRWTDSSHQSW